MNQTYAPAPSKPSTAALWAELSPTQQTQDYIRRIHWWVRLFGIVWIVIPVMAFLVAIAFALGALSLSAADSTLSVPKEPTPLAKCITEGYKASECSRWYSD